MKALISAYACEPGAGSEPGAGWIWTRAAAKAGHEVWLVTRRNNQAAIELALDAEPQLRVTPIYFDLSPRLLRWKQGSKRARGYYVLWQLAVRQRMIALHADVRFDIAHHLTFAVDWLPAAAVDLPGVPSIWGPVGGAGRVPIHLYRWLGIRGVLHEVIRDVPVRAVRSIVGMRLARRATLTVAQNDDVARQFNEVASRLVIEPNVALGEVPTKGEEATAEAGAARTLLFVGRLIPLKGLALAVATLGYLPDDWQLRVVGAGVDRARCVRLAKKMKLEHRISFSGQISRDAVLHAMIDADVFISPSMHDSAGWAVGEAVHMGTPVVCLDLGGPGTMARRCGAVAIAAGPRSPQDLAAAVLASVGQSFTPSRRNAWSDERLIEIVDSWYKATARIG